ncbi:hypothetical protein I5L59_01390 [Pseudomonas moraviensis]|uniref:P-loop NTPase fold protein n=1 Tax=Pseudomonas moraviensis TaxID=321662 RepID=UPI0018D93392|nr:P-loop NTPase fold protein [Pseudomonas moraviensis]MBH3442233.1 hypothetical protein [Pseudomonas moraviensis]
MDLNIHVNEFLDEYFFQPTPPQYAVMLKGAWGSGKTWFIKKAIQKLQEKNGKELYISLYGINSFAAIEEEFFKQLHPILSSKGMGLAGKVLKGVLKGTVKIDLDEHHGGTANVSIPELNLPEYLTKTDGLVLIFDDLERCSIPISDLLGYINHFVEHQDYKVIIIANEDEIILSLGEEDKRSKQYKRIKEKLIGKTFQIKADLDNAIKEFTESLPKETQTVLVKNNEIIIQIYNQSKFNNLRHLRQAFWDFSRLHNILDNAAKSNEPLVTNLLQLHLAFSIETRHGAMEGKSISKLQSEYISYTVAQASKSKQPELPLLIKLKEKYAEIDFHTLLIEANCWNDILENSIIDKDKINDNLKNSRYLISDNTPNWVKLWHFTDLNDVEFEALCNTVYDELTRSEYTESDEVKHAAGILILCSEENIFDKAGTEVLEKAKANIDKLKAENALLTANPSRISHRDMQSSYGLQFHALTSKTFIALSDYIKEQSSHAFNEQLPATALELLELMKTDALKFSHSLSFSGTVTTRFLKVPILNYIKPDDFVSCLIGLDRKALRQACYFLSDRYTTHHYNRELLPELDWLKKVKKQLRIKIINNKGKLTAYILGGVLNQMETAIKHLNDYKKQSAKNTLTVE